MPLDIAPMPGAAAPAALPPPAPEPAPAPEETAPPAPDLSKMTDAVPDWDPTQNPVVKLITDGDMPGILGSKDQFLAQPDLALIAKNPKAMLTKTGLGFFRSKDGQLAVFNPVVIKPDEVKALDSQGKLGLMLTPVDKLFGDAAGGAPGAAGGAPGGQGAGMYDSMVGGPPQPGPAPTMPGPMAPPANPREIATRMRASTMPSLPPSRTPSPTGGGLYNRVIQKPI